MLAAFWTAIWEFLLGLFKSKRERIEPVIEGYDELVGGQQGFIEALKASIDALNKSISALQHEQAESIRLRKRLAKRLGLAVREIKKLTKEVEECNKHRQQLEDRVKTLETNSPEPPFPQI